MLGDRRRVVVAEIRPVVDGGALEAKAIQGVPLPVRATLVADGHDPLVAWVRHGPGEPPAGPGSVPPRRAGEEPMLAEGNDRYVAWLTAPATGQWWFSVCGMPDDYGAWLRDLRIRFLAGQDITLELEEGVLMARHRLGLRGVPAADRAALRSLVKTLRAGDAEARLVAAEQPAVVELMRRTADRSFATVSPALPLWVDRPRAGFSAWYEMFPRSEGADPPRSGTFRSAEGRLSMIASMGFDIVYLPPIHPIGTAHRKGRNNSLEVQSGDPGSPWAIGGAGGGHSAVHPDLGTLDDFDHFVAAAREAGLEVALDYALQCSPDHPWVTEHPQWFRHRPDGSIRYAENPPKRYQDIYPINFDTDDAAALWIALRDVMLFWARRGVRAFRVDNPHTKPFRFWEWLLREVRGAYPEAIFLAEAFTRPAVMQRLAKLGFSQSYTYFTWRNSKWELEEYLRELAQTAEADWFRPNFWVNTPDILHAALQHGGPSAFRMRAAIAAITGPSWGMYSGYELLESTALREGSEEYLDSEKYQLKPRDWNAPWSIAPFIATLNAIRRRHETAIAQLHTLHVHHVSGDNLLCVSRSSIDRSDVLLLVVNLDPHQTHDGVTWLDLDALGISATRPFEADDELSGETFTWQGPENYVRLDPSWRVAHVLHLRQS
ncbi:MAG: alpha-1,4-glucan--maltose-1-phosphate maltosyltransferase [Candidatus Dormibacteraeota bacterium]|nr:alpha-1,4-glucan--maltose-1-phosphate maltosyltransferase [Candidatus Dormibacteraeota bacterium]